MRQWKQVIAATEVRTYACSPGAMAGSVGIASPAGHAHLLKPRVFAHVCAPRYLGGQGVSWRKGLKGECTDENKGAVRLGARG